jgi:hypothetical protein
MPQASGGLSKVAERRFGTAIHAVESAVPKRHVGDFNWE